MSLVITEEYLQAAERIRNRVKQGVNIEDGCEELNLDPGFVMELFKTPHIQIKKDGMMSRTHIVGIGLIPINLDDMLLMQVGKPNFYLHLELIEKTIVITDEILAGISSCLKADDLIRGIKEKMEQLFESMYCQVWKDNADKASLMPFKIFRSKLGVELKEKYDIKNL